MPYTPYNATWEDSPDGVTASATPITAAALQYIELGITNAFLRGPYLDPREFGAAADGITDDATAINAAITAAALVGKHVAIGQHCVGSTINLASGVMLVGGATGTRVTAASTSKGSYLRAKAGTSLDPMVSLSNLEGSGAQGVVFDGDNVAGTCVSSGGFQNKFLNCEFKDALSYGLKIVAAAVGAHECQVTNCVFSQNSKGLCLYVNAHDNTFIGNVFRGSPAKVVHFYQSGGHQFIGNHLYTFPSAGTAGLIAMHLQGSGGNQILGNYFDDWSHGPILKIEAYSNSVRSYDNLVVGNYFLATAPTDNTYPVIYVDNDIGAGRPAVWATTIANNTCDSFDITTRWTGLVHNDGIYNGMTVTGNRLAFADALYVGTRPAVLANNYICETSAGIYDDRSLLYDTNQGATSVADGGTVTHLIAGTPTVVTVNASTSGEFASVTAKSSTTFTCAIKKHDGTAGTTQTIYWRASL